MVKAVLTTCGLFVTAACASASQPAGTVRAGSAQLQAGLAEAQEIAAPGAAAALVEDGRTTSASMGAEWLGGRPVSDRTVFQIASLTKPFTAMVILKLAEDGRLALDDRAARWIDWLPADYAAVTVRQLLNHTSGVPRDLRRENVDEFTLDEFRRRFLAAKPSFAVGEKWEYSNTGYILLSLIAERAGSRDFGALLDQYIFRPAGMARSRYRAPLVARAGRAVGYDWVDGKWQPAPLVYSGFGNSGIESTAADLARFAEALQRRRMLGARSYQEMLSPGLLANGKPVAFPFRGNDSSYGLGWFLTSICGAPIALHGGVIAGFSSNLTWATDKELTVITLSNGKSQTDRIGVADKVAGPVVAAALNCPAK